MTETDIVKQVQIALSKLGHRVFRNNVGRTKIGEHWIQYGLCPGSSDLIGWTFKGRFLAIEVKTLTGKLTETQELFLNAVNEAGGLGLCVRSVDEIYNHPELR